MDSLSSAIPPGVEPSEAAPYTNQYTKTTSGGYYDELPQRWVFNPHRHAPFKSRDAGRALQRLTKRTRDWAVGAQAYVPTGTPC